jgi:hypothetical protein
MRFVWCLLRSSRIGFGTAKSKRQRGRKKDKEEENGERAGERKENPAYT